jgi:GrpB protein
LSTTAEIADYDPRWPETFAALRDQVASVLGPLAQRIEHVGSTAVPGQPASPSSTSTSSPALPTCPRSSNESASSTTSTKATWASPKVGPYKFSGRVRSPFLRLPADSPELARHLAFRDYLRTHTGQAHAYAELKRFFAERFRTGRDA